MSNKKHHASNKGPTINKYSRSSSSMKWYGRQADGSVDEDDYTFEGHMNSRRGSSSRHYDLLGDGGKKMQEPKKVA
jgi:hypothetical protein